MLLTLARLNKLREGLIILRETKGELEIKADSIPGGQISGMPSAKGSANSKEYSYISLVHDKDTILAEKVEKTMLQFAEEIKYIANITEKTTHDIFMYRFLYGWEWGEVAKKIGGKNSADGVRMHATRYLKKS